MQDNDVPPWAELPTALLLEATRSGSQPALVVLFSRYRSRSRENDNLLLRAAGQDTQLLDEAGQEAVSTLWDSRASWVSLAAAGEPVARAIFFEHFVAAVQRILARRHTAKIVHSPITSELAVMDARLEVEVVDLRWAIARLNPQERQLIQAWMMGGTKRETARLLGLPYTTTVYRLARVIDKLKETLRD